MEFGEVDDTGGERARARHWLRTRLSPSTADDLWEDSALTDVGLVGRVAHRTLSPAESRATMADAVAALTLLRHVREELAGWEPRLIAAARTAGASWVQLAPALGVASRQAAERRYLRLRPDEAGTARTGEQRVQAERDRRAGDRAVTQWARQNAIGLRQLAAQVSALGGDQHLDRDARSHVDSVTAALGEPDTAALVDPLANVGPHLQASHPALADKITTITHQGDRARRGART
jgi:hypothetical protein